MLRELWFSSSMFRTQVGHGSSVPWQILPQRGHPKCRGSTMGRKGSLLPWLEWALQSREESYASHHLPVSN
jgi:hypothetical protein